MRIAGYVLAIIAAFVFVFSLMFGLTWLGIEWRGFFGPKRAAVERQIFQETRSYNQGMTQQLSRYRLEYMRATSNDERDAIASTVRVMFSEYDDSELDPELRSFLRECGL